MKKRINVVANSAFFWPVLGCIVLSVGIFAISGKFNMNIVMSCAKLCVFALLLGLGQMLVVTSGGGAIDLSQKYILTLTAYVACAVMQSNIILGFVSSILVGAFCGFLSSVINVYLLVPAMITTLATGYMFYTAILVISHKWTHMANESFARFVNGNPLLLNNMTIICIVVAILLGVLLYRSKYGKQLHAIGQNRKAAQLANINIKKVIIIAFVIDGALCGLAGALCSAYSGGANQDLGTTYFLPSLTATFVGGTKAAGGKSSVFGVCMGALMMTFMSTFLNTANLSAGYQRLIQGAFLVLLLVAAVSDASKKQKSKCFAAA